MFDLSIVFNPENYAIDQSITFEIIPISFEYVPKKGE